MYGNVINISSYLVLPLAKVPQKRLITIRLLLEKYSKTRAEENNT